MPLHFSHASKRALLQRFFILLVATPGLVQLGGCRTGAFPQYPANYREYAYVANNGSNTISVLDVVHVRQQALLQVGAHPVALIANPMHNEVYALSEGYGNGNGSLAFIDAESNRVTASLSLGHMPSAAAIDSRGERLYITNAGSNSVSVVNLQARKVIAVAGVGEQPGAVALSPDNTTLVVANQASGSVSLLELPGIKTPGNTPDSAGASLTPMVRSTFAGCPGAGSIAILPDSAKAFIACSAGHQVMVISLHTPPSHHAAHSLVTPEPDKLLALLDVGASPARLIIKPDGGEIFVANRDADTISEIATGTNEVGGASLIGARPTFGLVSADNTLLWVANESADTVAAYSIDDGKLINTVHVGSGPGPMAFSADGHLLLAADTRSGDVSLLRTFSRNFHREPVYGTLFTLLPAGNKPSAIVDKSYLLPR